VASVELSGKTRVMVNVSSVGGARDLVVVTTFSIDGCLGLLLASQSAPKVIPLCKLHAVIIIDLNFSRLVSP